MLIIYGVNYDKFTKKPEFGIDNQLVKFIK
jgi:hypothetical protein